jgi:hypothetical protein
VNLPTKETSVSDTQCNVSSTDDGDNTKNISKRRERSVNKSVVN